MRCLSILILFFILGAEVHAQSNYTFVFLNKRDDLPALSKEETDRIMSGHMANIQKMAKEGKLLAAGPFDGGGGIFVFKASSISEVKSWLADDPGVQANRWNLEYLTYVPTKGGICPVGEKYEMISYTFVRFRVNLQKDNIGDASAAMKAHHQFINSKGEQILAAGSFGDDEGSIILLPADADQAWIGKDPAVQSGLLLSNVLKLYIAKGSFCEK